MKTIDKIKILFIITFIWTLYNNAQQQQHISWPTLADSPWPVLRGDMQGTGRSKFVGPNTNYVIWQKDMPLGILNGPVLGYNDILYMGERALSPDSVNYFYAIDKNGNNLWTIKTNSFLANNGAMIIGEDSVVYFTSATNRLYAIKSNGELKWIVNNIKASWSFWLISRTGEIYIRSDDTLVTISPSGVIKNKIFIQNLSPPMAFSTGGDTLFFYTGGLNYSPGSLIASDLNGNIFWDYSFANMNWGIPMVDNQNNIYVFGSDSQTTYYLNRIKSNGELDWRYKVSLFLNFSAPTIDSNGNILFNAIKIINNEEKNCIISLDYSGNENWISYFEGDLLENYINSGLVCDAEGKIYCGSSYGGYFYCFDSNGNLLWKYGLGEYQYDSCPAIGSDGTLYIGTHISSLFQNHEKNLIAIRDTVTSVKDERKESITYQLEQNYPNPFNSNTNIKYSIHQSGRVTITVYDIMGSEVAKLIDRYQEAGSYDVIFQPKDLASGIYFYTITSGKFTSTKKLILLK